MDLLDDIPVIGHAKALGHELVGDHRKASKAFRAANWSTAVTAAGAGGFVMGGPAGAAAGGMMAGTLMDAGESLRDGKARGSIKHMERMGKHVSNGEVPLKSTLELATSVGFDAWGGMGGANRMTQSAGTHWVERVPKSMMKSALKREIMRSLDDSDSD